jgi:TonB family protein
MRRTPSAHRSRLVGAAALLGAALLLGAGTAHAQWAAKPPPPLPLPVLDQAYQGAVTLRLVMAEDGRVRNAQVIRSSGVPALDELARQGAAQWRLNASEVRPSDITRGRDHVIKFYQDTRVKGRVPPIVAFWKERTRW